MNPIRIQIAITVGAILIAVAHLVWPNLAIDAVILILFVVAVIPWLGPLFKSVEFPGGWKIEFQDLQKAADKADKAGLLATTAQVSTEPQYSFQLVSETDPNLALAGLRIEIEKRLLQLAESNGFQRRRAGIGELLRFLSDKNVLAPQERAVLADMTNLLNSAVHGATVDRNAAEWAMEVGPRFLKGLDDRFSRSGK